MIISNATKPLEILEIFASHSPLLLNKEKNIRDSSQLNEFLLFNGINEKDLDYQHKLEVKLVNLTLLAQMNYGGHL